MPSFLGRDSSLFIPRLARVVQKQHARRGPYDWDITLGSEYWLNPPDARLHYALPLSFFGRSTISNISLPHWVLAMASVAVAIAPWLLHWPCRFSLRTLLIATTIDCRRAGSGCGDSLAAQVLGFFV